MLLHKYIAKTYIKRFFSLQGIILLLICILTISTEKTEIEQSVYDFCLYVISYTLHNIILCLYFVVSFATLMTISHFIKTNQSIGFVGIGYNAMSVLKPIIITTTIISSFFIFCISPFVSSVAYKYKPQKINMLNSVMPYKVSWVKQQYDDRVDFIRFKYKKHQYLLDNISFEETFILSINNSYQFESLITTYKSSLNVIDKILYIENAKIYDKHGHEREESNYSLKTYITNDEIKRIVDISPGDIDKIAYSGLYKLISDLYQDQIDEYGPLVDKNIIKINIFTSIRLPFMLITIICLMSTLLSKNARFISSKHYLAKSIIIILYYILTNIIDSFAMSISDFAFILSFLIHFLIFVISIILLKYK
jgi:lipopolysaccharide export LptBFGC system permease protein LptF